MGTPSENQKKVYGDAHAKHGDSPLATHQNDSSSQNLRFERLIREIKESLPASSVHDVGCGFGETYQYLIDQNIQCDYSGIEIVESMAAAGRKRYGIEIVVDDFLARNYSQTYDFVVLSGVFNMPGGTPKKEWSDFVHAMVEKMFKISRRGIVFNALTKYNDFEKEDLFYWDPREALDFCVRKLSRHSHLDASYPLYEWTMTVLRPDFVQSLYPHPSLNKYFKKKP